MTFLSANEIHHEINQGRIIIDPFEPNLIKPASLVLRIGNRWRQWKKKSHPIDIWSPNAAKDNLENIEIEDKFQINSGQFVLGVTLEKISVSDDFIGFISMLSHLGRFGLSIHSNSFVVNPGFGSKSPTELALELTSFNPTSLLLRSGVPVCHLVFARISNKAFPIDRISFLKKSIYEGRDPLGEPLLFEEFSSKLCDIK